MTAVAGIRSAKLDTPLGPLVVIADDHALHFLGFADCCEHKNLNFGFVRREIPCFPEDIAENIGCLSDKLETQGKTEVCPGMTKPMASIQRELDAYFKGNSQEFKTPLCIRGSFFQTQVWEELRRIPFGKTKSYQEIACAIDNPLACRAVGLANGANPFVIVIPCHRVIQANGSLGGYSAGLHRKIWLLNHERK